MPVECSRFWPAVCSVATCHVVVIDLVAQQDQRGSHRIESLNAFVACNHRDHGALGAFAICDDCRTIWEFTLPAEAEITAVAESKGFTTHEVMVELHGSCARCKETRKII